MRNAKKLFVMMFCGMLLAGFAASIFARDNIRVGYPAPAGAFLPFWTANDRGFFKAHGLSLELIATGSSALAIASMMAGDLDILAGGGTAGVAAQIKGYQDMAVFGNVIDRFVFSVYTHPSITNVAQLRGKKMGVTRFGGTLDFAARRYLRKSGLEPVKDVTMVQIGRMPDIVFALIAGSVEAGTIGVPQNFLAKRQGFRELADLSQMGDRYALAALVAKRSFLAQNHAKAVSFVKALVESIRFLRTNPKEGMEIMKRYTKIDDPEILKPAYDLHIKLFPRVPEVFPKDLELVLEEVSAGLPEASRANPAQLIEGRVVREVIDSGFVKEIYR
jgi:NitT/TauT family transport system substrate-binding protein